MAVKIAEVVEAVAVELSISKVAARNTVDSITEIIVGFAKEDAVKIPGLGTFYTKQTAARKGRNLQTGKEIEIPAGSKLAFKPIKK